MKPLLFTKIKKITIFAPEHLRGKKMNKLVKGILAVLGVTLVGGVIIKERNTLNEIRKDLWNVRWFGQDENKLKDECKN